MKFEGSVDINQTIHKVVDVFTDLEKLQYWQEGFVKKEILKGKEGEDGSVSAFYYINGKHKMELQETIIENNLPHTFKAVYHHKHMDNTMKYSFVDLGDKRTRYKTEVEYIRMDWVIPKLMAILFPGMYRKQTQKWMDNFKKLVEKNKL